MAYDVPWRESEICKVNDGEATGDLRRNTILYFFLVHSEFFLCIDVQ